MPAATQGPAAACSRTHPAPTPLHPQKRRAQPTSPPAHPLLHATMLGRVAAVLADAYEVVYSALTDPASGYGAAGAAAAAAAKHTPAAVRTILGVAAA